MITREEFDKLEGWFWWEEAEVMRDAIDNVKDLDGVIVECGSYKGKSTVAMASSTKEFIYAIDPHTWNNSLGDFKKQTAGYDNILPVVHDAATWNGLNGKKIKLLFIDTDHTYNLTKAIYNKYLPQMVDGGIILFHDCEPNIPEITLSGDDETNKPINGGDGWYGPTRCLQEARREHRISVEGDRSLHGVKIRYE